MEFHLILLASLWSAALGVDMCSFRTPVENIEWDLVKKGPWKWAAYTPDEFQDYVVCSEVNIIGENTDKSVAIDMKHGPNPHQVYTLKADYLESGDYIVRDFTSSWRNILKYFVSKELSHVKLAREVSIPRKEHVAFYTDYRNYFITALCMPDGRVSVAAFTMHKYITPLLERRIYGVLRDNKVLAIPLRADCRVPQAGETAKFPFT